MKKGTKNASKNIAEVKIKSHKVSSSENGIFSYFVDGFEEQLFPKINFRSLNFNDYNKNKFLDENIVGKIIRGSKCIIVCDKKVDRPGSYNIILEMSKDEIKCNLLESYDNISVFDAEIEESLISSRLENVKIETSCVEGIKIKKEAVYEINGQKGVFILDRRVVKFKEINIKHESKHHIICEYDTLNSSSLSENDAIIVSGNNLYDGKVLIH